MTTYSVRCRNSACRHRRVSPTHPDDYKQRYRCPSCKTFAGWRIEARAYNKRELCGCGMSPLYPHRRGKYKYCEHHPEGPYNQAKRQGVADDDIPLAYMPAKPCTSDTPPF